MSDPNPQQQVTVVHEPAQQRFIASVDGGTALLEYRLSEGTIVFTHTEVPPALEGRGIGGQLARAGLEFATREGLVVVPRCSFVADYVHRHPEYAPLLAPRAG